MDPNHKALLEKDAQFADCCLAASSPLLFNRRLGIAGIQYIDVFKLW